MYLWRVERHLQVESSDSVYRNRRTARHMCLRLELLNQPMLLVQAYGPTDARYKAQSLHTALPGRWRVMFCDCVTKLVCRRRLYRRRRSKCPTRHVEAAYEEAGHHVCMVGSQARLAKKRVTLIRGGPHVKWAKKLFGEESGTVGVVINASSS